MPRGLTARIAVAFLGVAFVTWLAIGATLFLLLRGLHAQTIGGRLEDQVTTLAVQAQQAVAAGDAQSILAAVRAQLPDAETQAFVVNKGGRIIGLNGAPAPPVGTFGIDPGGRGATNHGVARLPDGQSYAYGAIVVRPNALAGPWAIVIATQDRSARDALGDLVAAIPAVVVVSLLVGGPTAWLVARSVGAPLRRLSAATADVPTRTPVAPLPLEGPNEVRDLIGNFNGMTEMLAQTRDRETELLANLRHDLRTPLTVIGGFADALADGTATGEDAGRAARAIGEESRRLERLVDELGAIERLRIGTAGLRPEPLDALTSLREARDRFAPGAAAAGVDVIVVGDAASEPADGTKARAPARVNGSQGSSPSGGPTGGTTDGHFDLSFAADRLAVDRMLGNLVANALAAAPSPGGHVWLDARPIISLRPGDDGAIALSVTDDGAGFPPGTIGRVFERFYRADAARAGRGSGLGLAIVRELAEAHGGTAHAEQVAPHGARVSVVLPRIPRQAG